MAKLLREPLIHFLILCSHRALRTLEFRWPRWVELGPAYAIGSLGTYWTIQRAVMLL